MIDDDDGNDGNDDDDDRLGFYKKPLRKPEFLCWCEIASLKIPKGHQCQVA